MNFKEMLLLVIIIPIIVSILTGIIIVHYEDMVVGYDDSPQPETQPPPQPHPNPEASVTTSEPPTLTKPENTTAQLKQLHNPKAPWTVTFWLDSPGKTQFRIGDTPHTLPNPFFSNRDGGQGKIFSGLFYFIQGVIRR
ncbi:MAG: hypothetical protein B6247_16195 [Candidatus Parabeggiatoa sp. nov. 2]|nr:MAG: hypothetical protein B6247_16195 [Beggiatoa sp. 4572_84]